MQLTTKSEYSLLALIYLARHYEQGYIKIEELCDAYGLPAKYVEQLFYVMKRSGMVQTRRGAAGGYRLAKKPAEISVAQIVRLMDGALAPIESVSKYFYSASPLQQEAAVNDLFQKVRDYIADLLENTTLADLVSEQ